MKPTEKLYDPLLNELFADLPEETPSATFTQSVMDKVLAVEQQKSLLSKAYALLMKIIDLVVNKVKALKQQKTLLNRTYVISIVVAAIALIAGIIYLIKTYLPEEWFTFDIPLPKIELSKVLGSVEGALNSSVGIAGLPVLGGVAILLLLLGDLFLRRNWEHRKQHEHGLE